VAILTLPMLQLACSALPQAHRVPEVVESKMEAVTPPPGHELYETLICMKEVRTDANNVALPPKTVTIPVRMWVPRDRCLELSPDGHLRVVAGDCPVYPAKVPDAGEDRLIVLGDAGDAVQLVGGSGSWSSAGTQNWQGLDYSVYAHSGAAGRELLVQQGVLIV
jgi:hypothetical protein